MSSHEDDDLVEELEMSSSEQGNVILAVGAQCSCRSSHDCTSVAV